MRPGHTQFVDVGESQVAYQVTGDGPVDFVYMQGVASNFQLWWDYPPFARILKRIASFARLILFDRRGSGISDALPAEGIGTWESYTDDLRAVLDAAGSISATLFACYDGGPVAMTFAATNPDRVRNLVLWNSFARIEADAEYSIGRPPVDTDEMVRILRAAWGSEEAARYLFGDDLSDELLSWHVKVTLGACTPASYARQSVLFMGADARGALGLIRAPTLVLCERDYEIIPPTLGRFVADHVANARFVQLPGAGGDLFNRRDADEIVDLIQEFATGLRPAGRSERVLASVLFTDIVDSTSRAVELGDAEWTALLERHDDIARATVGSWRGQLVKMTGDGLLATFDGPGRALQAAIDLVKRLAPLGIEIRAGVHFGEIERRAEADIGGIGVHVAARVMAHAGAGEVMCTRTVKELSLGSGIEFADRGEQELKGVPGTWRLFSVEG